MMRFEDKVKWLAGALVLLLLAWGLGEYFSPERMLARSETSTFLAGKTATEAADILVKVGANSVHLVKKGGTWLFMDGADTLPVRPTRVEDFLSALARSGRRRPVAKAADAWKSLGLDDAGAKSLKISDAEGKVLLDLDAGNRGPTGSGVYVRFAGSNTSYLADADISTWLVADRGSWLDLRVRNKALASDAVQAIAMNATVDPSSQAPGSTAKGNKPKPPFAWKFVRDADGWKGGKATPGTVAVDSTVRAALDLEAVDLAATAPAGAFDKIGATITLTEGNGKTRVIEMGAPAGNGRWWVRVSEDGQVEPLAFQVSAWTLGSIVKDEASFMQKTS